MFGGDPITSTCAAKETLGDPDDLRLSGTIGKHRCRPGRRNCQLEMSQLGDYHRPVNKCEKILDDTGLR